MSSHRLWWIAVPLLLLITGLSPRLAEGRSTSPQKSDVITQQEVLKVDAEFNRAVLTRDGNALERILADRLSWIARGDRLDKAQVIADIKSGNLHFKSLRHDDLVIQIFGNTAVVTGHSTSVLEYRGKLYTTPRLFTSVYMKLDGRPQLVAHQVSSVSTSRKAGLSQEAH